MTARELHALSDGAPLEHSSGFYLRHPLDNTIQGGVDVSSRFGDIDLSVNANSGRACATAVAGLTPDQARELAGALERAAQAAENFNERNA